ncbi:hypothetical protein MRB53_018027 [Persea americana]|uniref:Uncharacterized protein n=1 Tax=Persea americana TaxID=3435 RepID=A0ACC2M6T4_PERAE|nr:hypothetical protein MRB53_018027 [Persea americana]
MWQVPSEILQQLLLLTADNRIYHKACFRCHHCKGTLKSLSGFVPSLRKASSLCG